MLLPGAENQNRGIFYSKQCRNLFRGLVRLMRTCHEKNAASDICCR